jgi:hypothetical protein
VRVTADDLRRALAERDGWAWLPCPVCREYMAGYEIREVHGHAASIPDLETIGCNPSIHTSICPGCTALGVGCYVNARLDPRRFLCHDCSHTCRGLQDSGRPEPEGGYEFPLGAKT